jgi:taurine transport system permease protein
MWSGQRRSGQGRSTVKPGRSTSAWTLRLLTFGVVIGLWFLLTELEVWSPLILPRPSSVWEAFVQSVTTDGRRRGLGGYFLWEHLRASLWRILNGVFWAIILGIGVGFVLASSWRMRTVFEPLVSFLRSLPPLAYFTILIFWFGIQDTSKIWLLFLAAFPPITLATMNGVERVRTDRVDAARSLGGSRLQLIRHVVMPSALPDIFTGIRVATGFALTTIVAAETVNGLPGIGGLAWFTKKDTRIDVAILCVIVIGLTAILLDQLIQLCERAFVPWKGHA